MKLPPEFGILVALLVLAAIVASIEGITRWWRAREARNIVGPLDESTLPMRKVHKALRKRYGRNGYRIGDDGLIEVSVRFADGEEFGQQWWGPFGNLNDQHCHAALARILSE